MKQKTKYQVQVKYVDFTTTRIDSHSEMNKTFRWKWMASVHAFIINTAPHGPFGKFVAFVEEIKQ